jgi:ascorbate-specific PTS system EIIC-type component UlaA
MANNNSSSGAGGGIGFVGLLTIVFIVLKLTGYIDWSWLWVLSPIWISLGAIIGLIGLIIAVLAFFWVIGRKKRTKSKKERVEAMEAMLKRVHGRDWPFK